MTESMFAVQQRDTRANPAARMPEAMRVAREILNNPQVSAEVRAIAASVIRRHNLPPALDS